MAPDPVKLVSDPMPGLFFVMLDTDNLPPKGLLFPPDDLVRVPKPSIALENGLLFLLLRVGVVMDPRPPSAKLLTLVVLPLILHPISGFKVA